MAKFRRKIRSAAGVALMMLLGVAAGDERAAAGSVQRIPRVRSDDAAIRAIVAEAGRRSATFRELIDGVDATDGIVYVERGRCRGGVRACLLMAVKVAGPSRILQIRLDPLKSDDETMVSLGHELRHALEVLAEPGITSGPLMFSYYKRFGSWVGDAFETRAAESTGDAIRHELRAFRDSAKGLRD
jgi:hypothetical protein